MPRSCTKNLLYAISLVRFTLADTDFPKDAADY
jgi:hypothetical protein